MDVHARHGNVILAILGADARQELDVRLSLHVVRDRVAEEARFRLDLATELEPLVGRGKVPERGHRVRVSERREAGWLAAAV